MGSLGLLQQLADINCHPQFLGFQSWNAYLTLDPKTCDVISFNLLGAHSGLLLILLAVLDDLFRAAGLLAVIFIIWSGVQFILSQGSPDEVNKARTGGINALVGLGISMVAILFVSFLGNQAGNQTARNNGLLDLSLLPNPAGADSGSVLQTAFSVAFGIIGAIAFLIIVIAGMTYAFSQGDANTTAKAKAAIVYAFVGLVIAIVAQSVVSLALQSRP